MAARTSNATAVGAVALVRSPAPGTLPRPGRAKRVVPAAIVAAVLASAGSSVAAPARAQQCQVPRVVQATTDAAARRREPAFEWMDGVTVEALAAEAPATRSTRRAPTLLDVELHETLVLRGRCALRFDMGGGAAPAPPTVLLVPLGLELDYPTLFAALARATGTPPPADTFPAILIGQANGAPVAVVRFHRSAFARLIDRDVISRRAIAFGHDIGLELTYQPQRDPRAGGGQGPVASPARAAPSTEGPPPAPDARGNSPAAGMFLSIIRVGPADEASEPSPACSNELTLDTSATLRDAIPWDCPLMRDSESGSAAGTGTGPACRVHLAPGRYRVYQRGSADARHGFCVGEIETDDPRTHLQRRLLRSSAGDAAWFRASWDTGRLELESTGPAGRDEDTRVLLMAELAAASQLGALTLRTPDGDLSTGFRLLTDGQRVVLPDEVVQRPMRRWYGPAADSLVPTTAEWTEILGFTEICLHAPYEIALGRGSGPTRICVALASLTEPLRDPVFHLRAESFEQQITPAGVVRVARLPQLEATVSDSNLTDGLYRWVLQTGDIVVFDGRSAGTHFCRENQCEPLGNGRRVIRESGVYEIRTGGLPDDAAWVQGRALARFVSVDVMTDAHPTGLGSGDHPADVPPWSWLRHDGATYLFNHRSDELNVALSLSPAANAVWNRAHGSPLMDEGLPGEDTVLASDLPVLGGAREEGHRGARPALVVLPLQERSCPDAAAGQVVPARVDEALLDSTFYVAIAQLTDESLPLRCLAYARFQVVERRILAQEASLRLTAIGDPSLVFHFTDPLSLGAYLPLLESTWVIPGGFALEVSVGVHAALTFEGAPSRTGIAAAVQAYWGIPEVLPRLITLGLLTKIVYVGDASPDWLSPFAGVNVGTLIDLAGGR